MNKKHQCERLFEVGDYEGNYTECTNMATHYSLGRGKPLPVCASCAKDFKEVGSPIEEIAANKKLLN